MAFLGPSLRRRKVDERPGSRTATAVVLSLAVNALILLVLGRLGAFQLGQVAPVRPVAIAPLTADQWAANRAITGGPPPPAMPQRPPELAQIPPPPPPEEERRSPGQIVDVAPSKDSRRPKDSRFLSDRDNTVEKETRSRHAGTQAFENTLPAPSDGLKRKVPVAPPPEAGEDGQAARTTPGKEGPSAPRGTGAEKLVVPEQNAQERLAVAPRPDAPGGGDVPVAPRTDQQRLNGGGEALQVPGAAGARGGGRKAGIDRRLLPDPQNLARIAGGPSPDRLDGVEEGDQTALNTRSFKYATFINRVGMAIYREWDPNRAYQARDPDGKVYPARDRTTSIEIVLDGAGAIRFVKVLDSSGLDFLDQEVVRAARAAGPFPNPPAGLMDGSGQIHLALAYTLEMRRASRVQVLMPSLPSQRAYPE